MFDAVVCLRSTGSQDGSEVVQKTNRTLLRVLSLHEQRFDDLESRVAQPLEEMQSRMMKLESRLEAEVRKNHELSSELKKAHAGIVPRWPRSKILQRQISNEQTQKSVENGETQSDAAAGLAGGSAPRSGAAEAAGVGSGFDARSRRRHELSANHFPGGELAVIPVNGTRSSVFAGKVVFGFDRPRRHGMVPRTRSVGRLDGTRIAAFKPISRRLF